MDRVGCARVARPGTEQTEKIEKREKAEKGGLQCDRRRMCVDWRAGKRGRAGWTQRLRFKS